MQNAKVVSRLAGQRSWCSVQLRGENRLPTHDKTALITGITGRDGPYRSELLLAKGYQVHQWPSRRRRLRAGLK